MSVAPAGRPIIMISLDAVSNDDVDYLLTLPNFSKLAAYGCLHREVDSVFVTNTYSVHTSISTGELPGVHGLFDNVIDNKNPKIEHWRAHKRYIKVKTLPTRATERGMVICSMMYPATPGEKIRYHIAEIPGSENILKRGAAFLRYTSFGWMFRKYVHYGRYLRPFNYYGMDTFIGHVAPPLIAKQKADLYLLHLLNVDAKKHRTGIDSEETKAALRHCDGLLGMILSGMQELEKQKGGNPDEALSAMNVLIFSDHACKNVDHKVDIHSILLKHGVTRDMAFFHSTSGACFLHVEKDISAEDRKHLDEAIAELRSMPCIARELTEEEMVGSGARDIGYECGFATKSGYGFGLVYRGQHGYTLDTEDYKIFYLEIGPDLVSKEQAGTQTRGGSVMEVSKKAIRLVDAHPGRK